ncbi:MAG: alpha/beta fold hydrolase [Alphaproteobacteria bacterium]
MDRITVNSYQMAYLDIGSGPAILCLHGSLNDFRAWAPVLKPFSERHRLLVPSLRHYFPEHWDGKNGTFTISQHVSDVIAFIEKLAIGPINLLGHSRGGHIAFRLAEQRPDLIQKLILAEPGGTLDVSLDPQANSIGADEGPRAYARTAATLLRDGDFEGGVRAFVDGVNGQGSWAKLPPADRQMREDNAFTLLAQENEGRRPFTSSEAAAISSPTLFIGGGDTTGLLLNILNALAAHVPGAKKVFIPNAGHSMFRQQPKEFARAVLEFLE